LHDHIPNSGMSDACNRVMTIAEDLIDKWPHSVPYIETKKILNAKIDNNVLFF
jgi:hypothetical protein